MTPRPDAAADARGPDAGHRDAAQGHDSGHGSDAGHARDANDGAADGGHRRSDGGDAGVDAARDAFECGAASPEDASGAVCGARSGMRGLTHRSVTVGCKTRTYEVYLPASADPATPMPLVFVFHGLLMSGAEMNAITGYTAIADAEGIGVVFPDGEGGPNSLHAPWNVDNPGQQVCGEGDYVTSDGDDFGFIDAMKADIANDQCLDTAHLFSAGFSMGGYFTHHIACYRSDMRGAAAHSGGTLADLSPCTNGHVPIIVFHGAADGVIDEACDDPTASVAAQMGFPPSATLWAAKNGCKNTYTTLPTDSDAGGTGQCYLYDGCPADGQVEACIFNGMEHCWAGGNPGDADVNACPTYAKATQLQWAFFKKYAW